MKKFTASHKIIFVHLHRFCLDCKHRFAQQLHEYDRENVLRYVLNSTFSKNICLSCIPARLKKLRSKLRALCAGQSQIWAFFCTQGQVTLRQIVIVQNGLIRKTSLKFYACPGYLHGLKKL